MTRDIQVERAIAGDRVALDDLMRSIQDKVYGLALRMLYAPADAEDAGQEILIKVITHLSDFRGESSFSTWVWRIAANHLLGLRKKRARNGPYQSFEDVADEIDRRLAADYSDRIPAAELGLLREETRVACTMGLLLCMSRELRLAYILAEVFDVSGEEGGYIMAVDPRAFRRRLSRARRQLVEFMTGHCSLVNPQSRCTCEKMVPHGMKQGGLELGRLTFTGHPCRVRRDREVMARVGEWSDLHHVAAIYRSHPDFAAPASFLDNLAKLVESGRYGLFV
jgi:RNA polymerase sigma factor (sigma-70 family)